MQQFLKNSTKKKLVPKFWGQQVRQGWPYVNPVKKKKTGANRLLQKRKNL